MPSDPHELSIKITKLHKKKGIPSQENALEVRGLNAEAENL